MRALLLAGVIGLGWVSAAQAAYILAFQESGTNVIAKGSGSVNTKGLTFLGELNLNTAYIYSQFGIVIFGSFPGNRMIVDQVYYGINNPSFFGNGNYNIPTSSSGDVVGLYSDNLGIILPTGYVSGTLLSNTSTFERSTLSTLGLTSGDHVYNFGSGVNFDTFTVQVIATPAAVPEPTSVALLSLGVAGIAATQRRKVAGKQA